LKGVSIIVKFLSYFVIICMLLLRPLLAFADQFKVVSIYDGDTITVAENGKEITIRLVGIDAPEISRNKELPGQPFCLKSKEHLSSLVLNTVVHIKFYGKDASGKSLGEIFADEVNINIEMINAGLAEVYRGVTAVTLEITAYRAAEKKAKEDARGIWELQDQYFSPWDWREMHNIGD
jgi:endonuclease YncB( thermonuclease family)